MNDSILTLILLAPLAGAVLVALLPDRGKLPAWVALLTSLVSFGLTLQLPAHFVRSQHGFQFEINRPWIENPAIATFAAFGSFAMLLLVDFGGPMRARLQAQIALSLTGCAFVCLGTLASQEVWTAVVAMTVIGFAVIFSGVVSSVLAGASTSLLLAFILPVTLAEPVSSLPDCVAGWGMASGR